MKIKQVLAILHTKTGYYGFRITRCSDGKTVEGHITGEDSNITSALTYDGNNWTGEVYVYRKSIREKELFALPYAGCEPEKIREWARKEFKKKRQS